MKKIIAIVIALLMLVGCVPSHETNAVISFDKDYSGELVLLGEIDTTEIEEPASEIEEKITKIIKDLDRFKEGALETSTESKVLKFTYTEPFKDLKELNKVLSRVYDQEFNVTVEETDSIFKKETKLEGFYIDAKSFMDPIYDVIEKDEVFGEDSDDIRIYQSGEYNPILIFDGEEIDFHSSIGNSEYRYIDNETLFIEIVDVNHINMTNVIEASKELDLDDLEQFYEDNFFNRVLSKDANADFSVDKNIETKSLTVNLDNVNPEDVEDLQYDVFNRMIELSLVESKENKNEVILDVYNLGYTIDFEEIVLETSTVVDLNNYKIIKVDDEAYENQTFRDFKIKDNFVELDEFANFTLVLKDGNIFSLNNILKYVLYALIALFLVIGSFITIRVIKKNKKTHVKEQEQSHEGDTQDLESEQIELKVDEVIKRRTKESLGLKIQSTIFNLKSLKHTAVMILVSVFVTILMYGSIIGQFNAMNTGLVPLLDFNEFAGVGSIFRMIFLWMTTGGLSAMYMASEMSAFSPVFFSVSFSFYAIFIGIVIVSLSYFISSRIFVFEDKKDRARQIYGGTLWYTIFIFVFSFIPFSISSFESTGLSLTGNKGMLMFGVFPFLMIVSFIILTLKDRFSSHHFKVSGLFYEGFKKISIVYIFAILLSIITILIEDELPFFILSNLSGLVLGLFSGQTITSWTYEGIQRVGLLGTEETQIAGVILFLVYILIVLLFIGRIYRRNNIVNKNKFAFLYTLSIVVPIYGICQLSGVKVSTIAEPTTVIGSNFGGFILSFVLTFIFVIVTLYLTNTGHPLDANRRERKDEHMKTLTPETSTEKETAKDVVEVNVRTHKQRPMDSRRHRRRLK